MVSHLMQRERMAGRTRTSRLLGSSALLAASVRGLTDPREWGGWGWGSGSVLACVRACGRAGGAGGEERIGTAWEGITAFRRLSPC